MTDPERYRIERQIVGLCLVGRHMVCLDILRPQHFADEFHRRVFSVVSEMAAAETVDMITVSRKYSIKYKENKAVEICEIVESCLLHGENSYCLLLLEIDIRSKFVDLIEGYEKTAVGENDFESAAIWKQCRDHLGDPDTDIFKGVDAIHSFLKQYKPDEILEYEEMMEAIPKTVDRIKSTAQTMLMMENLQRNVKMKGERERLFKITTDILVTLMVSGEIPKDLRKYLEHIETNIL